MDESSCGNLQQVKKDPEPIVWASLLKERGMVSIVSGALDSWRATEGGESLHARLKVGSEAGEWPDRQRTPALSPASSLPPQDPARSAGFHPSGSVLAVGTVTGR